MAPVSLVSGPVPSGQPIFNVPLFYANEIAIQISSTDATIILMDTVPVTSPDGIDSESQVRRPIATLKVSPQTLKGFAAALTQAVNNFEAEYGELNLPTTVRTSV